MIIKVCGMRKGENIREVEGLGVDFMGFIFYPKSPRYVDVLPDYLPQNAKRVGVFVDENLDTILSIAKQFRLEYIQLHGNESPVLVKQLNGAGYKLIKAFSIAVKEDLNQVEAYKNQCSYFIFDTKSESIGGSGQCFDWNILQQYKGDTPFLLSGGISLENLHELKQFQHNQLVGYDLNSCFELSPAVKDCHKLSQFLNELKQNV